MAKKGTTAVKQEQPVIDDVVSVEILPPHPDDIPTLLLGVADTFGVNVQDISTLMMIEGGEVSDRLRHLKIQPEDISQAQLNEAKSLRMVRESSRHSKMADENDAGVLPVAVVPGHPRLDPLINLDHPLNVNQAKKSVNKSRKSSPKKAVLPTMGEGGAPTSNTEMGDDMAKKFFVAKSDAVKLFQKFGLKNSTGWPVEKLEMKLQTFEDIYSPENLEGDDELLELGSKILEAQEAGREVLVEADPDEPAPKKKAKKEEGKVVAKAGKEKPSKEKPSKPEKKEKKEKSGPSNKEVVYKEWVKKKAKDPGVDYYFEKVSEKVKRTTIRNWISSWKSGNNLPACARVKEKA